MKSCFADSSGGWDWADGEVSAKKNITMLGVVCERRNYDSMKPHDPNVSFAKIVLVIHLSVSGF